MQQENMGTIEFDNGFVYNNGGSFNFKEGTQILNGNNANHQKSQ